MRRKDLIGAKILNLDVVLLLNCAEICFFQIGFKNTTGVLKLHIKVELKSSNLVKREKIGLQEKELIYNL